jgi:hypothetical protein
MVKNTAKSKFFIFKTRGIELTQLCILVLLSTVQKYQCNRPTVLRIRDVYPGSRIRLLSIPDPGSRIRTVFIPDPGSRILIKVFKYFNPQKSKKNGF